MAAAASAKGGRTGKGTVKSPRGERPGRPPQQDRNGGAGGAGGALSGGARAVVTPLVRGDVAVGAKGGGEGEAMGASARFQLRTAVVTALKNAGVLGLEGVLQCLRDHPTAAVAGADAVGVKECLAEVGEPIQTPAECLYVLQKPDDAARAAVIEVCQTLCMRPCGDLDRELVAASRHVCVHACMHACMHAL